MSNGPSMELGPSLSVLAASSTRMGSCPESSQRLTTTSFVPISSADSTLQYMQKLQSLVLPKTRLIQKGYVLDTLDTAGIELKKRCMNCGKVVKNFNGDTKTNFTRRNSKAASSQQDLMSAADGLGKQMPRDGRNEQQVHAQLRGLAVPPVMQSFRCRFHNGVNYRGSWSCCRRRQSEDGCCQYLDHVVKEYAPGELERLWQHHCTPTSTTSHTLNHRLAVAIDCEMGTSTSNDSALIRVTLVDFFTSEVLVDQLVKPDVAMLHYNTRYSGVTRQQMNQAIISKNVLNGKKGAREAVWRFVGPNTIVVGHSAQNDLTALRWIHTNVVDTCLIDLIPWEEHQAKVNAAMKKSAANTHTHVDTSMTRDDMQQGKVHPVEAKPPSSTADGNDPVPSGQESTPMKKIPKGSSRFSLKMMARLKLGREIQCAGKNGHDSLEDALASRDIAHWHIQNLRLGGEI